MKKLYLYPLWLRTWHWTNAALYLLLILTGISMHYAGAENWLVPFEKARLIHNTAGILLTLMYLFFLLGNLFLGNGKHYRVKFKGLTERLIKQTRYYLYGIFKGEQHPYHASEELKFNPLQQITYISIMYLLTPFLVISGLMLIFPETAPTTILGVGGVWPVAILHTVVAYFLTLFMFGHIYLGTTGNTLISNFKSMISGWETIDEHTEETKEKP
jgi:thiosulfate reductase cytochrome b subunit